MSKLIVAGCSVSDYTHVDKVWGEYLANMLDINYLHVAAGCGSNYRIWRLLSKYILNKEIMPDDIVLVQYTTLERNEFWSPKNITTNPTYTRDPYNSSSIIRFKIDSSTWHHGIEKKMLKMYENFINLDFELEKFKNYHMMFQCLAKEYNIKNLYFVQTGSYGPENLELLTEYQQNHAKFKNIFTDIKNCLPNDRGHLSSQGHQILAKNVYKTFFYKKFKKNKE